MIILEELTLQKLSLQGVQKLVEWAAIVGWNPGANDAEIFYNTDKDGFCGYYYNNELIAGGSVVSYDNKYGFMGFFIVLPEFRASGIGRKLWYERRNLLLERLNKNAPIGMDGVVAMQPFYNRGGFEIAFKDERYEVVGNKYDYSDNVSLINDNDIEAVLDYDSECFGLNRPQFLLPWIQQHNSIAFKYIESNILRGFAIMRKAMHGFKICPLFADNLDIAEELYKACLNYSVGESVYIDIPMSNKDAIELVNKYYGKYVFECARMYYGKPLDTPLNKIFGITTFELG